MLVDTAGRLANTEPIEPGATITLEAKSLIVLGEHEMPQAEVDHSVASSLTAQVIPTHPDNLPAPAPKPEL